MADTEPAPLGPDSEGDLDQDEVTPVDRQRVIAWMRRTEQRYFVGGDGIVGGIWNGCLFTFNLAGRGAVLQIRGQMNRVVAIERRQELIELFNARHARAAWPKCFLMVLDDGSMRVAADHSTLIAHGLSERQLDRAIRVGLGAGLAAFGEINARYPDPLAHAPEGLL